MSNVSGRIGSADPATRPPAQAPAGLGDTASVRCAEDIYDRLRDLADAEHGALSRIYSEAADEIEALRTCAWHLAQGDLCEETECADPKGDNCVCFNRLVIFYRGSLNTISDRNRRSALNASAGEAGTATDSEAND